MYVRNPSEQASISHTTEPLESILSRVGNENREMTVVLSYVKQLAASAFERFKRITKENGSIYKSIREGLTQETNYLS